MLQSLESIMIVLIAALLFREYPSREFVFYSVLVLLGISIVLGVESHFIHKEWLGTALITLGMLAAAFYVVLSSRIAEKYDFFYIVASQQTLALIVALFLFCRLSGEDLRYLQLRGGRGVWPCFPVLSSTRLPLFFTWSHYGI